MKNRWPTAGIEQNVPLPILQQSPQCTLQEKDLQQTEVLTHF